MLKQHQELGYNMKRRVAIISGVRTPFCKAGGLFRDIQADDLGAWAVKGVMNKTGIHPDQIDQLIFGNVLQPLHAANIARVIAIKANLPVSIESYTVNRNCASGLESITSAATLIRHGRAETIIAGGVESMSNTPILFPKEMTQFLRSLAQAKTWSQKLKAWAKFRPSYLLPELPKLHDPLCGLSLGQTAELLAREWEIDRNTQDAFALSSQQRAAEAQQRGYFNEEIVPVPFPPEYNKFQMSDDGIRDKQTLEALANLKPAFDRNLGSVTAGNSSQITDGAVAFLLMSEEKAKEQGLEPLGYIKEYAYAGLDPAHMGLGPVFATSKVLKATGLSLNDIDLIEINEAFAAQVLACIKAFTNPEFAKTQLGHSSSLGEIGHDKINVNGGAIAMGHPLGASGARLVLTLLHELKRRDKKLGLATLCIGGGQGGALIIERGP
jgi:acetyl-CoA acyltransferase